MTTSKTTFALLLLCSCTTNNYILPGNESSSEGGSSSESSFSSSSSSNGEEEIPTNSSEDSGNPSSPIDEGSSTSGKDPQETSSEDTFSSSGSLDGESSSSSTTGKDPPPPSICGNYNKEPGEDCDFGGVPHATCDEDCTFPVCGDGYLNELAKEECDDGNDVFTDECTKDCKISFCGDGWTLKGVEDCDDKNSVPKDGCENSCKYTTNVCGEPITPQTEWIQFDWQMAQYSNQPVVTASSKTIGDWKSNQPWVFPDIAGWTQSLQKLGFVTGIGKNPVQFGYQYPFTNPLLIQPTACLVLWSSSQTKTAPFEVSTEASPVQEGLALKRPFAGQEFHPLPGPYAQVFTFDQFETGQDYYPHYLRVQGGPDPEAALHVRSIRISFNPVEK